MQNISNIPERFEINLKYKWELNHIYESLNLWESDFNIVEKLCAELTTYKGTLSESPQKLIKCLNLKVQLEQLFDKVYVYARMSSDQDTRNTYYQSLANRADSLNTLVIDSESFIIPEILSLDKETLQCLLKNNKELSFYKRYLDEILRMRPHTLSEKEEHILAMASEITQAPRTIFNMINNADIKFPDIQDDSGNNIQITKARFISLLENRDRELRKNAFNTFYGTYSKYKNTFASILNSNVKANIFNAKARNFSSALESSLFLDNVPVEVYDNLIKTIHDNLHLMHRYISLRKKVLKLNELHMYDIYTPIITDFSMNISYEEAVDTIKKSLEILGRDYLENLNKGFNSGWIDVYENKGKMGGAYSWGCYTSHPYVLLNYNNTLDSMLALAHEMGHSMHSYYSNLSQPYLYSQYKIFVAEVASTLNECLLLDYMLKNTKKKEEKIYLINHYIENFRSTVYRQTMFAEFEKIIHEKAENGEALTSESLCLIYHDLNIKYYGPDIIIDEYIDMEWARIPHFYKSFYVYMYATGFCAATSLSHSILSDGDLTIKKYIDFIKSGSSDFPIELLKKAGIDMSSTEPINKGLNIFKNLLDELETLLNE